MNFYLNKYGFIEPQISDSVKPETNIIVVIPCFNEPDLITSLQSLADCDETQSQVEVIVVLNSGEHHSEELKRANEKSSEEFDEFKNGYAGKLSFFKIEQSDLPKKHAGVGLARKIGMDEAVSRFHQINHDGIIVCFDADAKVDANYLVEIEKHFENNPKSPGCSIHYEHPLKGDEFSTEIYRGIINYELHLRYYNQCLRYSDLPYVYHTVGSSMAVKSSAYQKQGGMNKRKAGEDFYFIHKIIALGGFTELTSTKVIPSPRVSDRVPFGTGKAIEEWLNRPEYEDDFYSYNFYIFKEIKLFVSMIPKFYEPLPYLKSFNLHPAFEEYFEKLGFQDKVDEMKANTKDFISFRKRFFVWFDAFAVLKLIHFMQTVGFGDVKLKKAVNQMLLEKHALEPLESEIEQLLLLREIEKV
jgi:Glycosyl transferase family group 2